MTTKKYFSRELDRYIVGFAVTLFLALTLMGAPAAAADEDPRVADVIVEHASGIKVSFVVKDAFTKDIEEAIKSGIPTSFTFIMVLDRVNSIWFDSEIARREFKHTVKYDTLKQEYEVNLEESGQKEIRTADFNEMKALMTAGTKVSLEPSEQLAKGRNYELRVKAELHTIKLPFLLDYMLFFVKFWDFETDWYIHGFTQ